MVSFLGAVSIVCLLVAVIMLLNLIQQAFANDVRWGCISVFYPPGTYFFCRKNWDQYGKHFVIITGLLCTSLVLFIIVKLFA